jgi:hypothetical protein
MTNMEDEDDFNPHDVSKLDAHGYLRAVYQGRVIAEATRMKAAIESLPFEKPKLALATNVNIGMAAKLEAAHSARLHAPQTTTLELQARRLEAEGSRS